MNNLGKSINFGIFCLLSATGVSAHQTANCDMRDSFTVRTSKPNTKVPTLQVDQRIAMLDVPMGSGNWYVYEYIPEPFPGPVTLHRIELCNDGTISEINVDNSIYEVLSCTYYFDTSMNTIPDQFKKPTPQTPDNYQINIALIKSDNGMPTNGSCNNVLEAFSDNQTSSICNNNLLREDHCVFSWNIHNYPLPPSNTFAETLRIIRIMEGSGSGSGGTTGH